MTALGRRSLRRPLTALVLTIGLALAAAACTPVTPSLYSPNASVYFPTFADPEIVSVGDGTYRGFSTNAIYGSMDWPRIPTATASSLSAGSWSRGTPPDALPEPLVATWQRTPVNDSRYLYWAPAVHQFGATWVMYYTAPRGGSPEQCIGAATSATVDGPYTPVGAGPLVCDAAGGSIDPSVVVDGDGAPWLLWKNDGNCCNLPVYLWSRPLAADGLGFDGDPRALIGVDQAWEDGSGGGREPWKRLVEGPAMVEMLGVYWLFYSANWWDSDRYATGYAACTSPAGNCAKQTDRPLLGNGAVGSGPGGPTVVTDPGGQHWLAYHAWDPCCTSTEAQGTRTLRISKLDIANAIPVLGASP